MTLPKKQHFVPRFYLKNFGKQVFCYDKLNDKVFRSTYKDLGHENYFYEIDDVPQGTSEKIFAEMEGRFSQSYNRLIQTCDLKKLTESERWNFFLFLSVQFQRTSEARFSFKDIADKMLDAIFGKEGVNIIPDELKVTYSQDSIKKFQMQSILEETPRFAHILSQKTWVVQKNPTEIPLWTSDNPLAFHNEFELSDGWGNLGLLSPGVEIHFPLSSSVIMFSYDPTTSKLKSGEITEEQIIRHNNYQVNNSTRFLYSQSDDFTIARNFLKKFPKYKKPQRDRGTLKIKKIDGADVLIYDKKDSL